jgi:peptidoglycan/LPS O-acetylase OafA/YrhL
MFGKYSYGLYVYHGIIAEYMIDMGWQDRFTALLRNHPAGMVAHAMVGVTLSLAMAVLSYELFEKRFLALKRYFEAAPPAPAAMPRPRATSGTTPARP